MAFKRASTRIADAIVFLEERISDKAVPRAALIAEAKELGISEWALEQGAHALDVTSSHYLGAPHGNVTWRIN